MAPESEINFDNKVQNAGTWGKPTRFQQFLDEIFMYYNTVTFHEGILNLNSVQLIP